MLFWHEMSHFEVSCSGKLNAINLVWLHELLAVNCINWKSGIHNVIVFIGLVVWQLHLILSSMPGYSFAGLSLYVQENLYRVTHTISDSIDVLIHGIFWVKTMKRVLAKVRSYHSSSCMPSSLFPHLDWLVLSVIVGYYSRFCFLCWPYEISWCWTF